VEALLFLSLLEVYSKAKSCSKGSSSQTLYENDGGLTDPNCLPFHLTLPGFLSCLLPPLLHLCEQLHL
jgi:hypothetical protein